MTTPAKGIPARQIPTGRHGAGAPAKPAKKATRKKAEPTSEKE